MWQEVNTASKEVGTQANRMARGRNQPGVLTPDLIHKLNDSGAVVFCQFNVSLLLETGQCVGDRCRASASAQESVVVLCISNPNRVMRRQIKFAQRCGQ